MAVVHTVKLSDATTQELTNLARQSELTKSEIIRAAVDQYLEFQSGRSANPRRIAELMEYSQMILDHLLEQSDPSLRDNIIDNVALRMAKYHGG